MVSAVGCTITVTVVVLERPLEFGGAPVAVQLPAPSKTPEQAVTVKVKDWFGVSSGTAGAVKLTFGPAAVAAPLSRKTMPLPAGAAQLKVRVPFAGSTPVAASWTGEALLGTVMVVAGPTAGGPANAAVALTAGGVFGGAITIGTVTLAGAEIGTRLPSPTISWNVRFCGPATTGATNVAFAADGLLMVTIGSPGLTTWVHVNGPVGGVLAVPSRVTVTPANGGFGLEVNFGSATVASWPETQVSGGSVASGNGFSCVIVWFG